MIRLRTLGTLDVQGSTAAGRAIRAQPKRLALLLYLAVEGAATTVQRDTLLSLFWPELDGARARAALRQAIRFLRRALGEQVIESGGRDALRVAASRVSVDALELQHAATEGRWDVVVELYAGEFLQGFHVAGSDSALEEWISAVRRRLHLCVLEAHARLRVRAQNAGDVAAALAHARRAAALAPLDETVHRALLELLLAVRDTAGALQVHEQFAARLERELGAAPDAATRALISRIRSGEPVQPDGAGPAIAVRPFLYRGADASEDYLAEGFTEDVVTALASVPGLRVIMLPRLGASVPHGAPLVLEGSVQRSGNGLRIAARLCRASPAEVLWSDTVSGDADTLFLLQETVARNVGSGVRRALGVADGAIPRAPTADLAAYHDYLRGRHLWSMRPRAAREALTYLERATARDPGFALAHAAVADAYNTLGSWEAGTIAPLDAFPRAQAAAIRALELNPSLAQAHTPLGYASAHYLHDWRDAERHFRRALALDPCYAHAHHWYSHLLLATGRVAESLAESRRALLLDPLDSILNVHLAWHYWLAREPEQAIEQCARTVELDPADPWPHFFHAVAAADAGDFGAALPAHQRALERAGGNAGMIAAAAHTRARAGDQAATRSLLRDLERSAEGSGMLSYELALIHFALGEDERGFARLEQARRERSAWIPYLAVDPRLDRVRPDGRLRALLAELGLASVQSPIVP